jgi:hypothetical protein
MLTARNHKAVKLMTAARAGKPRFETVKNRAKPKRASIEPALSALLLLMLRILADNHHAALALDYLAFLANRVNRRSYLHVDSSY